MGQVLQFARKRCECCGPDWRARFKNRAPRGKILHHKARCTCVHKAITMTMAATQARRVHLRITKKLRHAGPTTPGDKTSAHRRCLERLVRRVHCAANLLSE